MQSSSTGFSHSCLAAFFYPEVDFHGCLLQRIAIGDGPFEHICINVSTIGGKSFLVLGWQTPNGPAEQFAKSFKSINNAVKANSSLIMAVEQIENTYFNPPWWNSLNDSNKYLLVQRMRSGIGDNSIRPINTYRNIEKIIQPISVSAEIGTI